MAVSNSKGACTVVLTGKKVSTVGAVLADGIAVNALDMDDGDKPAKGRSGACFLPVRLAVVELNPDACGLDLLTAIVIGYEVTIRAAAIRHATCKSDHSSGSWDAIGEVVSLVLGCARAKELSIFLGGILNEEQSSPTYRNDYA